MERLNKDRLISIVLLLGALVFVAWLPPEYSMERVALSAILIISGFIWLARK